MTGRILGRAAAGVLAAALLVIPARADTIGGATVSTRDTGLNLRARATTASEALTVIPNGSFLLVEEAMDGWYRVSYNGQEGYVASDYAVFSETLDGTYSFDAATRGSKVNMRSGAGLDAGVVCQLAQAGADLTITGVSGRWLRVQDNGGTAGYIRSDLIDYKRTTVAAPEVAEAQEDSAALSLGEQISATALQYLGCRYTWGGMSPETGFDCSGFVNYIYKLYGVSMERVAQNIYYSSGDFVDWDARQPGDVLCFGYGPNSVGHVGIYIGNDQMVHASTYTTGVILTDLSGSYYDNNVVGVKRMIG